jgi:hypothetical protein
MMQLIQLPAQRIMRDIFANPREIALVADDMFVVVALPDGPSRRASQGVNAFGRLVFEERGDLAEG